MLQGSADERRRVTEFERAALNVIGRLEAGDVMTYGEVAEEAGFPGAARAVGRLLSVTDGLAWWRILGAGGRLNAPDQRAQSSLLQAEGWRIEAKRVVGRSA
jgi:methylated-DNA-protein-cysteine methyltransferase-like protein